MTKYKVTMLRRGSDSEDDLDSEREFWDAECEIWNAKYKRWLSRLEAKENKNG